MAFSALLRTALSTFLLLVIGSCFDGGGETPDVTDASSLEPEIDAAIDAQWIDSIPPADGGDTLSIFGTTCSGSGECGIGGYCLGPGDDWPPEGYCTRSCSEDLDCGAGAFCSDGPHKLCFASCWTGDTCPHANLMCSQIVSAGTTDLGRKGCVPGKPAADGAACASFGDCRPIQRCETNKWVMPGGMCFTPNCTVGNDATCAPGGDGHCADFGGGPECVDACIDSSDCREANGHICRDSGSDEIGKYCTFVTGTGDACTAGTCGSAPWTCLILGHPTGYCTATGCDPDSPTDPDECSPFDAACYDPTPSIPTGDEYCARRCTVATQATDCRVGDGYTCQDLDGPGPGTLRGCLL